LLSIAHGFYVDGGNGELASTAALTVSPVDMVGEEYFLVLTQMR
jgi:hypothetical protein